MCVITWIKKKIQHCDVSMSASIYFSISHMPEVEKKATAQRHMSWAGKIMGGHQGQEGHKEKSFF